MRSLNKANYGVWEQYMKDENNQAITDRILILDAFNTLTPEEEDELNILQNLERKFIMASEEEVDLNKSYIRKFNYYKNILENCKDDRLLTIFYERVNDNLTENEICVEDDLQKIYTSMMEEDMDVDGHDELNKLYQVIVEEKSKMNEPCDDPDCIYCRPISFEEREDAIDDLHDQGYFTQNISEREKLIKLMVTIHRLQDDLAIYKPGDDIDLENDDLDDDDEDY